MRAALIAEQLLAPVPGGIGRYTRELACALARTAGPGDRVTSWIAWHRDPSAARVTGIGGPHRLALPRRALTAAWERGLGPRPGRADLVHAPSLLLPPRRRPLVVTIHDTVPWTHPETLTPRGAAWHLRMAAIAARTADAVIVPTRAVAADLERVALIPAERMRVIGLGVSPELSTARPDDAEVVTRLRLPERYVLSLATLEPRKGLGVLLRAWARADAPPVPLVVAGQPGWGGVDPDQSIRRLGLLPGRVILAGRLPDRELGAVLRRATVLTMPSSAEGFGLPVAEAMAAGVAVVTSDAPALREVGADAARAVPYGDDAALAGTIREVIEDATQREAMIRRGRELAAAFDWDAVARATWRVYRDAAGTSSRR